ncbi:MAG: hypothetical protein Q8L64_01050 [bacterium]|nr:hypothetical protein [bacterium]
MSLNAMDHFPDLSKMIHRPPGSFRLETNLTRTFVPEFLFRFDCLHKFFTGGPDAEISPLGEGHYK